MQTNAYLDKLDYPDTLAAAYAEVGDFGSSSSKQSSWPLMPQKGNYSRTVTSTGKGNRTTKQDWRRSEDLGYVRLRVWSRY